MISSIHGEILNIDSDGLVINIGGIGFKVLVPESINVKSKTGDNIFLFTHLIVREDLLALYGFESEDEREIFIQLLGVNGVGPRIALGILSSLSVDTVRKAVLSEQPALLSRVPGVGNKTAQKIILYLQGKIRMDAGLKETMAYKDVDSEVIEALTGLGYSVIEAQAALQSIPRDTPDDLETRLRLALQYFST
jgi:Holliday junction DNA helicase RuvA